MKHTTFTLFQENTRKCSHHSTIRRRDEATVNREEAAAHENLQNTTGYSRTDHKTIYLYFRIMVHFLYQTPVFYLNEFISAVKLRHQNIFSISQSGKGHAQPPGGLQVSVSWKFLQQRVLHHPQQTERWVDNTQRVFPRLSRHIQQISTELL